MIAPWAEISICVILGILVSLLIILAVLDSRNDRKHEKDYQEYVNSIQIGDTFGHNIFKVDDPFSENYDTQEFDPQYHVTILDIKKNNKGETWVKYCFTRVLNEDHCEWTEEINKFLRCRTRISRRIDNINTNE